MKRVPFKPEHHVSGSSTYGIRICSWWAHPDRKPKISKWDKTNAMHNGVRRHALVEAVIRGQPHEDKLFTPGVDDIYRHFGPKLIVADELEKDREVIAQGKYILGLVKEKGFRVHGIECSVIYDIRRNMAWLAEKDEDRNYFAVDKAWVEPSQEEARYMLPMTADLVMSKILPDGRRELIIIDWKFGDRDQTEHVPAKDTDQIRTAMLAFCALDTFKDIASYSLNVGLRRRFLNDIVSAEDMKEYHASLLASFERIWDKSPPRTYSDFGAENYRCYRCKSKDECPARADLVSANIFPLQRYEGQKFTETNIMAPVTPKTALPIYKNIKLIEAHCTKKLQEIRDLAETTRVEGVDQSTNRLMVYKQIYIPPREYIQTSAVPAYLMQQLREQNLVKAGVDSYQYRWVNATQDKNEESNENENSERQ